VASFKCNIKIIMKNAENVKREIENDRVNSLPVGKP
jgi:hypothetical protein